MRRSDSCLRLNVLLVCFIVFLLSGLLFHDTACALTASYGQPYHGRLENGIPFPSQFRGYQLREEDRTYTTPEVAGALLDAIEGVRAFQPNTCDLYLGDFSRAGGGPATHHRSHQNGRDVDLGMYAKGNRMLTSLVPMNEENLDTAKTWCLIEGLLRSQRVQYIFLDRRVQKLLFDYAVGQGVDQSYLDRLFANARGSILQHVGNHVDHMHVRFFTPWSTLAAHIGENEDQKRVVIEMAQQSYLPKKVQYYAKGSERGLEALAQSFGVTSKDLCRWNNLHGSEVLAPGSCVVFYKRGFELEPVHLAQSLQPFSMPQTPVQVASLRPEKVTLSDAPVTIPESPGTKEKKKEMVEAPVVSTYTAHRRDTLDKIAKRNGLDVDTLCEINGMGKREALRSGQKIKLSSLKSIALPAPPQKVSEPPKINLSKSMQVLAAIDAKKARVVVPVAPPTYTVGKGDSWPKICKQTGVKVEALCEINGLKKNTVLMPGQKLQLARLEPASKAALGRNMAGLTQSQIKALTKASVASKASDKSAPVAKNTAKEKSGPASKTASSAKATALTKPGSKADTTSKSKKSAPTANAKPAPAADNKNSSKVSAKPSKAPAATASSAKGTASEKEIKQARK